MGKMIEQIGIRKTRRALRVQSSASRFGPDPLITIPARGFWKCRNLRPDRRPHSITCTEGKNPLAQRAATTEGLGPDRPRPIGKARDETQILADMLLTDPAGRDYPARRQGQGSPLDLLQEENPFGMMTECPVPKVRQNEF